jgi:hypothetical protein
LPSTPGDLAGDLGIVGPPDDPRGGHPKVPEPLRAAVFQIPNVGAVLDHVVETEGKFFIVRMAGITAGHTRTLAEADRSIRVALIQEKLQQKEEELEAKLRQKFPIEIDERALANVKVPSALDGPDLGAGASNLAAKDGGAPSSGDAGASGSPDGGK